MQLLIISYATLIGPLKKKMVRGEMRNDGNKRRIEILLGKYLAASSTIIPCLRRN